MKSLLLALFTLGVTMNANAETKRYDFCSVVYYEIGTFVIAQNFGREQVQLFGPTDVRGANGALDMAIKKGTCPLSSVKRPDPKNCQE